MRYWIPLVAMLISISSAYAGDKFTANVISLEQVVAKVLEHNPQILAGDIESRAAVARVQQAQQSLSPLTLKLELENVAGSGVYSGNDRLETTLSLAKVLELGRKPELRESVAKNEANLLRNEQDARKLDLLAEATRRFVEVVLDQHKLKIAKNKLALIKGIQDIVAKRVRLGKSPQAEQRRVRIELERAKIELEHIEHELKTSRVKLSSTWGKTSPGFISAQAELFSLQEPGSFQQLEELLTRNPDIVQYATQERLAAARLNLANSRSRSDVEISGGIRHFHDTSDTALVLSASMPFGSSSRAKPFIGEAQLLSQLTPYNREQRRITLYTNLYALYQEIHHAIDAVKVLREIIIPEAELVLRDYKRGYEAGRYSLIELNTVQRTLLDAQLEAAVTASNYHRNKIEIERLTGSNMARLEKNHEVR
ncbi:TolC family protein [Sulfuriflexus mobilis]|uniref:TolC family protein n=1 Tax=Sulfuriflexus mobilis TaxID=1811807 RepID=UPI000F819485|nr:TolC family protein [Sulfuriflexus mobilis]